jgi:hypothetical protein
MVKDARGREVVTDFIPESHCKCCYVDMTQAQSTYDIVKIICGLQIDGNCITGQECIPRNCYPAMDIKLKNMIINGDHEAGPKSFETCNKAEDAGISRGQMVSIFNDYYSEIRRE